VKEGNARVDASISSKLTGRKSTLLGGDLEKKSPRGGEEQRSIFTSFRRKEVSRGLQQSRERFLKKNCSKVPSHRIRGWIIRRFSQKKKDRQTMGGAGRAFMLKSRGGRKPSRREASCEKRFIEETKTQRVGGGDSSKGNKGGGLDQRGGGVLA